MGSSNCSRQYQETLGDYSPRPARSQDFGDRAQQMSEQDEQVSHGGEAQGTSPSGASLPKRSLSGEKLEFATHSCSEAPRRSPISKAGNLQGFPKGQAFGTDGSTRLSGLRRGRPPAAPELLPRKFPRPSSSPGWFRRPGFGRSSSCGRAICSEPIPDAVFEFPTRSGGASPRSRCPLFA